MVVAVPVPADVSACSSSGGPNTGGGSCCSASGVPRRSFPRMATQPAPAANTATASPFSTLPVNTIFATNPPTGENTNDQIGSHCHQTSRPTPAMAATTATAVTHFFMRSTLGRQASTGVVLGHVSHTHPRV